MPQVIADTLYTMSMSHVTDVDLYRILVYDCPPLAKKSQHPITRQPVDITSLAMKRMVKQIVLVSGDGDFVPAAKLARREGIDVVLDPMWSNISDALHEHIDGLRSTSPRPAGYSTD